jgi:hypothetical protein
VSPDESVIDSPPDAIAEGGEVRAAEPLATPATKVAGRTSS